MEQKVSGTYNVRHVISLLKEFKQKTSIGYFKEFIKIGCFKTMLASTARFIWVAFASLSVIIIVLNDIKPVIFDEVFFV